MKFVLGIAVSMLVVTGGVAVYFWIDNKRYSMLTNHQPAKSLRYRVRTNEVGQAVMAESPEVYVDE